ncbi:hypothetical protein AB0H12_28850 [Actinosynnema sp. NPDC023794]
MNPSPNARGHAAAQAAPAKASIVPYFLAHLLTGMVVFVAMRFISPARDPLPFGSDLLYYVTTHLPVPLVLSTVLAWLLTRRARLPFWAVLLLSVPFYLGASFVYMMGQIMASTQQ